MGQGIQGHPPVSWDRAPSRLEHLETILRRYPEVNPEVILKEDMLREGFLLSSAILQYGGDEVLDTRHHFSWNFADARQVEAHLGDERAILKVPTYVVMYGGPYCLRPTCLTPRVNPYSSYLIDLVEGQPRILDRATGYPVAGLFDSWRERGLDYLRKRFPDGTSFVHVLNERGASSVFRQCQHWGRQEECLYCDIDETARLKKELGEVQHVTPKVPEQVAEAAFHLLQLEEWPHPSRTLFRTHHIHITGGTITTKLRGMVEDEFYLRYIDAIRERVGGRASVDLQTAPWPKEKERLARAHGVTTRSSNYEVWDPRLFAAICPGKARFLGREEWIRRVLGQVEVFGIGNVTPGFVAGVEMARPWGFQNVEEAVRSTTEGMRFFMSHGVVVRPISWCAEGGSALANQPLPPLEYYVQVDRNWYELYLEYDLPPQHFNPIGPGRNTYVHSAAFDMGN